MHPIVAGGLLLGGLCGAWIFTTGFTGLYKDPAITSLFVPIMMVLEVGALIWGLRKTAAMGRTYSGQVVAGTFMAMIGAVIIFCSSLVLTSVLYPNFFVEVNEMSREVMRKAGQSEAQIKASIDAAAAGQTPVMAALFGVLGTMMTGIIASAIIAIWVRAHGEPSAAARA